MTDQISFFDSRLPDRFWSKCTPEPTSGCWLWMGTTVDDYGRFWCNGRVRRVHRYVYETVRGAIPDGLTIDHRCNTTICVNPDHLDAVTNKANVLRSSNPTAVNARKMTCKKGHPFTRKDTRGYRMCGPCPR